MDNWGTMTGDPLEVLAWLRALPTDGCAVIIRDHKRREWRVSLPYAGRSRTRIEVPLAIAALSSRPRSTWTAAIGPCGAANVADELERLGLGRDAQEARP